MSVRYEAGQVRLLWARPNAGFDVKVMQDGPEQVVVRFRDDHHRSRVRAFYRDGAPAHEVNERSGDEPDPPRVEPKAEAKSSEPSGERDWQRTWEQYWERYQEWRNAERDRDDD